MLCPSLIRLCLIWMYRNTAGSPWGNFHGGACFCVCWWKLGQGSFTCLRTPPSRLEGFGSEPEPQTLFRRCMSLQSQGREPPPWGTPSLCTLPAGPGSSLLTWLLLCLPGPMALAPGYEHPGLRHSRFGFWLQNAEAQLHRAVGSTFSSWSGSALDCVFVCLTFCETTRIPKTVPCLGLVPEGGSLV